jgi:hypothetical protein
MTTTSAEVGSIPFRQLRTRIGWRIAVSVISLFGLASFLILYFAFWARGFAWIQGIAWLVVSVLGFIAANGAAWASWSGRFVEGVV